MSASDEQGAGEGLTPVSDGHAARVAFLSGDIMTRYWGEALSAAAKKKSKKKAPKKAPKKKPRKSPKKKRHTNAGPGCITDQQSCTCSNGCAK